MGESSKTSATKVVTYSDYIKAAAKEDKYETQELLAAESRQAVPANEPWTYFMCGGEVYETALRCIECSKTTEAMVKCAQKGDQALTQAHTYCYGCVSEGAPDGVSPRDCTFAGHPLGSAIIGPLFPDFEKLSETEKRLTQKGLLECEVCHTVCRIQEFFAHICPTAPAELSEQMNEGVGRRDQELEELREQLKTSEEKLKTNEEKLTANEEQLKIKDQQIQDKDRQIEDNAKQIEEKDKQLVEKDEKLEAMAKELEAAEDLIKQKDKLVKDIKAKKKALEGEWTKYKEELQKKGATASPPTQGPTDPRRQPKTNSDSKQIKGLEKALQKTEETVQTLTDQLNEAQNQMALMSSDLKTSDYSRVQLKQYNEKYKTQIQALTQQVTDLKKTINGLNSDQTNSESPLVMDLSITNGDQKTAIEKARDEERKRLVQHFIHLYNSLRGLKEKIEMGLRAIKIFADSERALIYQDLRHTLLVARIMRMGEQGRISKRKFIANVWSSTQNYGTAQKLILIDPRINERSATKQTIGYPFTNHGPNQKLSALYNQAMIVIGEEHNKDGYVWRKPDPPPEPKKYHLIAFHAQVIRYDELKDTKVHAFSRGSSMYFSLLDDSDLALLQLNTGLGTPIAANVEIDLVGPAEEPSDPIPGLQMRTDEERRALASIRSDKWVERALDLNIVSQSYIKNAEEAVDAAEKTYRNQFVQKLNQLEEARNRSTLSGKGIDFANKWLPKPPPSTHQTPITPSITAPIYGNPASSPPNAELMPSTSGGDGSSIMGGINDLIFSGRLGTLDLYQELHGTSGSATTSASKTQKRSAQKTNGDQYGLTSALEGFNDRHEAAKRLRADSPEILDVDDDDGTDR